MAATSTLRVAIAGFGTIGREIARRLADVPGIEVVAVAESAPRPRGGDAP